MDYAANTALLGDSAQAVQHALDRLSIEVSRYGVCFLPSKSKVVIQVWQEPVPALILCDNRLEVVKSFKYFANLVDVGEEVSS